MKRILLIILGIFILGPLSVEAETINSSLSCNSAIVAGQNINCDLIVTTSTKIDGISGNFNFDSSKITFVNFEAKNGFTALTADKKGFGLMKLSGATGTFTVGTITLKVNAASKFDITNYEASYLNGIYDVSFTGKSFRLKSTNNSLRGISLSSGSLSPSFSPSTTTYNATVNVSSVTISVTKGDNYQTVSGTGKKNLSYGNNKFNIVVTSEAGAKKTYTINITRPDNRSTNNYLSNLTLSSGSISFNKAVTSYNVEVPFKVSSIKVGATLADSKASFVSGNGPRTVSLKAGKNTVLVKVKAENGSIKTYTLNINRKDNRSTNNYLSNLSLSVGNLSFNKNTLKYNVEVENSVTSVNVGASLEDSKASFVNGFGARTVSLKPGNNEILIKVKAENDSIRTYTVNVNRNDGRSSNAYLKSLSVSSANLDFSRNVLVYNVTVPYDVTKVEVLAEAEDSKAKVIVNNPDLVVGENSIIVTVIAENNFSTQYVVKVIRKDENTSVPSSGDNNNITSIDILGHDFEFKSDKTEYEIDIKDEFALVFEITLEDENARSVIEGNENLKDGSVIKVTSVSENGSKKEYLFNINKKESSNLVGNLISGAIGFVLGVISSVVVFTILGKKRGNKKIAPVSSSEEVVNEEVLKSDDSEIVNAEPANNEEQF